MGIVLFVMFAMQSGAPIGMVLPSQGQVLVQRGASKTPAKLADLLYAGDQVIAASGQAAFLFCPSSERVTISSGGAVELGASAISARAGAAPARAPARCALPKVALGAENLERIGGLRPRGDPPISIYVGGPVATVRPAFEWAPVSGTTTYHVRLSDGANTQIWQQQTTGAALPYPSDAPDLKPGKYQWEVRAEGAGKRLAQQSATFEIKPDSELARAVSGSGGGLSSSVLFEEAGYFAEAAAGYRELLRQYPDDLRLARRLAVLYWSAGLIAATNDVIEKYKLK